MKNMQNPLMEAQWPNRKQVQYNSLEYSDASILDNTKLLLARESNA